jgi:hypothetical protein
MGKRIKQTARTVSHRRIIIEGYMTYILYLSSSVIGALPQNKRYSVCVMIHQYYIEVNRSMN